MPKATPPVDNSVEAKLDTIIQHLERMDKRDRLRTIGGFIHSFFSIIPLILLLASAWYFVEHGAELMKQVAGIAASAAADATKNQGNSMLDELMKQYSVPKN